MSGHNQLGLLPPPQTCGLRLAQQGRLKAVPGTHIPGAMPLAKVPTDWDWQCLSTVILADDAPVCFSDAFNAQAAHAPNPEPFHHTHTLLP
jgi:hypothetical protein